MATPSAPLPHNPLIVALDVATAAEAEALCRRLQPYVGMVKVGLESFVGAGPDLVRRLRATGVEIFLDLKLHDIPRTAAAAAAQVAALDVSLLTVHAAGGGPMLAAVRANLPPRTRLLAVTMLTSFDDALTAAIGMAASTATSVHKLGALARQHGADGLVCSAAELAALQPLGGLRVVPGIRPAGSAADDQRRAATPQAALAAGATYIVVGRPIVASADPVAAAQALLASLSTRPGAPSKVP